MQSSRHLAWLLLFALACSSPTAPKPLSSSVLSGQWVYTPASPFPGIPMPPLYESPSVKVEAVSASIAITSNLTYSFIAEYRVTRAAEVTTVEWKNSGSVRVASADDSYVMIDLVENGSSAPILRGAYTASICLNGYGLSIDLNRCTNIPQSLFVSGLVPRSLIPDAPDISFGYKMY